MSGQNPPGGDKCRGRGKHGGMVVRTVGPGVSSPWSQPCYNSCFTEGFDTQPGSRGSRSRAGGPWVAAALALVTVVLATLMVAGPAERPVWGLLCRSLFCHVWIMSLGQALPCGAVFVRAPGWG